MREGVLMKKFILVTLLLIIALAANASATNTNSLNLNGNQSVSITNTSLNGLNITGTLTIEVDVNPDSLPALNSAYVIIEKGLGSGDTTQYSLRLLNSGGTQIIQFFTYSSALGFHGVNHTYTLPINSWTHLSGRFDGSTWKIIKNGEEAASVNDTRSPIISDANIGIGCRGTNNVQYFKGKIDNLRIWNTSRTIAEIAANYDKELTGIETGLVGYWKFNGTLTSSAVTNTLTNNGGATFSTDVPFTDSTTSTTTTITSTNPITATKCSGVATGLVVGTSQQFLLVGSGGDGSNYLTISETTGAFIKSIKLTTGYTPISVTQVVSNGVTSTTQVSILTSTGNAFANMVVNVSTEAITTTTW